MALQTKMVHYIEAHVILYQLLIRIYVVGRRESRLFHHLLLKDLSTRGVYLISDR